MCNIKIIPALVALLTAIAPATAQDWPQQPVKREPLL